MQLIAVDNVGIKESAIAALGYSVYPNPIAEFTTVSYFIPEKSEVKNWEYIHLHNLESEIHSNTDKYTEWLKISLPEVRQHFDTYLKNDFQNAADYASI